MRHLAATAATLALALTGVGSGVSAVPVVEIAATPGGGIQPQSLVDAAGTMHLIYFKGEPRAGNLFYVQRKAGAADFSPPLQINSQPGTAIAAGSVRGGQIAIGRNGWVHVAWNGSKPVEQDGEALTPMWYARLAQGTRAFEAQRPIGSHIKHLDGGGSIAADPLGRVHVVWHAAGLEPGEPHRRLYVATSADDGAAFAQEKPYAIDGGACGCCGMETLADGSGRLQILYRAAGSMLHRDAMWMTIGAGAPATPVRLQAWELAACPMTTFAMAPGPDGIVAAWETQQQIFSAVLNSETRMAGAVTAVDGHAIRKHPAVAVNAAGDRLIAWTEGTAWARGGTLAWELRNRRGERLASQSNAGAVPVWGLVSAIARRDGSFLVVH